MLYRILSHFSSLYGALVYSKYLGKIYTNPETFTPDIHLHEMISKCLLFLLKEESAHLNSLHITEKSMGEDDGAI